MTWPGHALITGASGQLGIAFATRLAANGCQLSLCSLDASELQSLAEGLVRDYGVDVRNETLDVRDADRLREWVGTCDHAHPIDWLIPNAGVASRLEQGAVMETAKERNDIIGVNLAGVANTLDAALPFLRQRRRGKVIIVSSLSALIGYERAPVYAATKAALRILGLSLRPALAGEGIGLTVACPGFLSRPMQNRRDMRQWDRPMAVSADAAADAILAAALRGKAQCLYPPGMVAIIRTLAALPIPLRERAVRRLNGLPTK